MWTKDKSLEMNCIPNICETPLRVTNYARNSSGNAGDRDYLEKIFKKVF